MTDTAAVWRRERPCASAIFCAIAKIADLALAGPTPAQVNEAMAAAIARKELSAMESGAMCYMVSKQGYRGDSIQPLSHLMFFYSQTDPAI